MDVVLSGARRKQWVKRDEKIQKLKTKLENGSRMLDHINAIKAVSFN